MINQNIETESRIWDFTANSSMLLFVAAALGVTLGVVGFISYTTYVSYYSYYGYSTPEAVGFWMIAGLAVAAAAAGILSGVFALIKKRFTVTLIGPILLVISGVATFAIETSYKLSFSDGITIPAVMMISLAVIALPLLLKSKTAFVDYSPAPAESEESEMPPESPAEPEETEQTAAP
ncbi:hypothetical protein GX563_10365 [Candidatus Bathyarchaeota archaeon]|nr:hypothetical protein [Candidatus Bathyarchaeota archaeon]